MIKVSSKVLPLFCSTNLDMSAFGKGNSVKPGAMCELHQHITSCHMACIGAMLACCQQDCQVLPEERCSLVNIILSPLLSYEGFQQVAHAMDHQPGILCVFVKSIAEFCILKQRLSLVGPVKVCKTTNKIQLQQRHTATMR